MSENQQYVGQLIVLDENDIPRAVRCILDNNNQAVLKMVLNDSSVKNAFNIIPDDTTDLIYTTIALYVGSAGDVKVDLINGDTIIMKNLAGGAWHPVKITKVYATGTTATDILGAY